MKWNAVLLAAAVAFGLLACCRQSRQRLFPNESEIVTWAVLNHPAKDQQALAKTIADTLWEGDSRLDLVGTPWELMCFLLVARLVADAIERRRAASPAAKVGNTDLKERGRRNVLVWDILLLAVAVALGVFVCGRLDRQFQLESETIAAAVFRNRGADKETTMRVIAETVSGLRPRSEPVPVAAWSLMCVLLVARLGTDAVHRRGGGSGHEIPNCPEPPGLPVVPAELAGEDKGNRGIY